MRRLLTYRAMAFTVERIRVRNRSIAPSVIVAHKVIAKRDEASGTKAATQRRMTIIDLALKKKKKKG